MQITALENQRTFFGIKDDPLANLAASKDDSDTFEPSDGAVDDVESVREKNHTMFKHSRKSLEENITASSGPAKPGQDAFDTRFRPGVQPGVQPGSPLSTTVSRSRRKILQASSSSSGFISREPSSVAFTPEDRAFASSATGSTLSTANPRFLARKSASSPTLYDIQHSPPPYSPPVLDYSMAMPSNAYQRSFDQASSSSSSHSYASWSQSRSRPHSRTQSQLASPKHSDSEGDQDNMDEGSDNDMIYTSRSSPLHPSSASKRPVYGSKSRQATGSNQSLRSRIFALATGDSTGGRDRGKDRERGDRDDKMICTTPGVGCAGETETETDEPSRHLPTARIVQAKGPLVPPNTFQERLTPLLFEFSRLLSIVPALIGTVYNLYYIFHPPSRDQWGGDGRGSRAPPDVLDFFVAALWSMLTGYQCLCITTGLLTRWRLYYQPLSTLVRLLALQGICWPATQVTLTVMEHAKRPVLTWAVIGTTTCCSRSVQIWVTSNLWWEKRNSVPSGEDTESVDGEPSNDGSGTGGGTSSSLSNHLHHLSQLAGGGIQTIPTSSTVTAAASEENRRGYLKRFGGGKWGGRRWDWKDVGLKCVLPAGVLYFVMALVGEVRREFLEVSISGAGC
ncbi:N-glycosylation protein-domain-containing protein [Crepidotus variabilis]|uniref:N-glycosylation protein-domain-containing protein n=1 Tax=Crepidotus variabilis TaxID=179855 RepID=A0A9P6JQW6_9AGAR|nr:N-glycosylation protein-domain-containing protein [Crepidotus variabilis]